MAVPAERCSLASYALCETLYLQMASPIEPPSDLDEITRALTVALQGNRLDLPWHYTRGPQHSHRIRRRAELRGRHQPRQPSSKSQPEEHGVHPDARV
jgi:hypothetical protein